LKASKEVIKTYLPSFDLFGQSPRVAHDTIEIPLSSWWIVATEYAFRFSKRIVQQLQPNLEDLLSRFFLILEDDVNIEQKIFHRPPINLQNFMVFLLVQNMFNQLDDWTDDSVAYSVEVFHGFLMLLWHGRAEKTSSDCEGERKLYLAFFGNG
jgi:hypothetical protein